MNSAKKVFIWIDLLSLLVIFSILFLILLFIRNNIRNQYFETQMLEIKKIDTIIHNLLTDRKDEYTSMQRVLAASSHSVLISNFSDIYKVDSTFTIREVLKRDAKSHLLPGLTVQNSKLQTFLFSVKSDQPVLSPLIVSPEREELSLYLAAKIDHQYLICRIGIDKINAILEEIASYNNNIFLITTRDGYVVSSTYSQLPIEILPATHQKIINLDKPYFFSRKKSEILANDFVILKPVSQVYNILDKIILFYPYFSLIILMIFLIKLIIQFYYIFQPLESLMAYIRSYNPDNKIDVREDIGKTTEVSLLYDIFNEKMQMITQANYEIVKIKQYLKNIIDSMPSMLISIDQKGIIQEWNEATVKYFHIPATEVMGKKLWEVLPYFSKYQQAFNEVIKTKNIFESKRELLKNGEDKYMNISIFPLEENGVKGMAIRLDDITQLEKTEQILRQSQKMETIGTLAGGIAHDFNNILGGIVGTLSMMKIRTEKSVDLNSLRMIYQNYISIMEDASKRATSLVAHLLTLSRRQEPNFSPVDLNQAISQIETVCRNSLDKSIDIEVRYYPETAMIMADINQIEQVLLNICINAAHAMTIMRGENEKQGGILNLQLIRILTDKHFVKNHPEADESLDYWVLSVSDTGIGMDAKILSKIFDPFFTTKEKGKGTGLGLSMVYNIIQMHSGFIDVYSESGHGTTVNIYLPVSESTSLTGKDPSKETRIYKGYGQILVIDDEQLIRNTYYDMLTECGYEVYLAPDGYNGVDFYKENYQKIDLIILDMAMPKISGYDTYLLLKEVNPAVKVLMASGFRQDDRVIKAIETGVNGFLQKPFTVDTLSKAIKNILILNENQE